MLWAATFLLLAFADEKTDVAELMRAGRQRDAADAMMRLLDEKPADTELRGELVKLEIRIGRYAAALDHAGPLGPEFDATRGKALYLLGRYEAALAFLRSDDADSILFRHEALRALTRFDEASQALEQAAKLLGENNVEVCVRRGQALAREGKFELATEQFRPALEREPLSSTAIYGLGRALISLGNQAEGLELLERHRTLIPLLDNLDFARRNLELDLGHAPNHAALGDALRTLLRFDAQLTGEIRESYARAAKFSKGLQVVPIALRHARFFEEDLHDPAQAVRVLDEAFTKRKSARLAVRAGDIWMRASRAREAIGQYFRALDLRPNDESIASRLQTAEEEVRQQETER